MARPLSSKVGSVYVAEMDRQEFRGIVLERTCSRCANQWAVPVRIAAASATLGERGTSNIEGTPVILLTCRRCGSTNQFTEVVLG